MRLFRLVLLGFCLLPILLVAQQDSPAKLKKQADTYFDKGLYSKANYLYQKYQNLKSLDSQTQLNLAICAYETNDINTAATLLNGLMGNKQIDEQTYLYSAKILHSKNNFKEAVKRYKEYLGAAKSDDENRRGVRDLIRNCSVGMKLAFQKEAALVENLGRSINTKEDDFAPVESPNYSQKIYFSSARSGSKGGLRNASGRIDSEYGSYNSDIYFSRLENGSWNRSESLGGIINSSKNEVLIDFNSDGSAMYFYKGLKNTEGQIYVDTFSNNDDEVKLSSKFDSEILTKKGDQTPFFYNDSLTLFASFRPGGYGGYDLYATVKKDGEWQTPFNLGPKINSAYDEISPFLSLNGRTLYFSSNDSRRSSGGFDVFTAKYDKLINEWTEIKNMGLGINSSEDDSDFRLTKDGMKALFTSSRKSGFGKRDLYIGYFKAPREEQKETLFPITFIQLEDIEQRLAIANTASKAGKNTGVGTPVGEEESEEKKLIKINNIYFDDDNDVVSTENKKKIAIATELLKRYPSLQVLLLSHSDSEGPLSFDMYFSIKRAEKVANEMIAEGIDSKRIVVTGFGPIYPIALNKINGEDNAMGKKLNRRIEFRFIDTETEEFEIEYEAPTVSKFQYSDKGDRFKKSTKALFYKIQFASTKQMLEDNILDNQPDPMVEKRMDKSSYHYTIGLYRSFSTALQFQRELEKVGVENSKIIPYLEGYRIPKYKLDAKVEAYPDLKKYLDFMSEY